MASLVGALAAAVAADPAESSPSAAADAAATAALLGTPSPAPGDALAAAAARVAVICLTRAQARVVRALLRAAALSSVRVGTVDDMQGQEADFVFVSTVAAGGRARAAALAASLSDPRSFNVATTRARRLLVVVGDPVRLLAGDAAAWGELLRHAAGRGGFVGAGATELEALGPVNELAVTERDELEQRHEFIKEQRRDLERSMESLGGTVKELDATCAERFLATLAEVNVAFDDVFRRLFGGGEAKAELSDPDAPLESGIEIRVRPPGKHAQSVLLLSGGEKALAAVALLLALFRIRPAPFCLLDEVDAPLDDANVERLAGLLREMSGGTQFLLITHNRRTMAHADVLYGVTMEESGVSRIVSVRLEE